MINPSKKQLIIVYAVAAVLAVFYILSLTVFSKSGSSKKYIQQLQLLHEADISNIDIITIQSGADAVILTRTDNMWLIVNQNDVNDRIPADTQRLQKFFVLLVSKHNMTKAGKSDSSSGNSYGLDSNESTVITLYKNGAAYETLSFGALNFSQTERYFTTQELKSVYLAGQEFDGFLNVSVQSWADPYIISEQLKNDVFVMGEPQGISILYDRNSDGVLRQAQEPQDNTVPEPVEGFDFEKLFDLRHGGFSENLPSEPVLSFIIQMGDKSTIQLDISQIISDEDTAKTYLVKTTFDSERLQKSVSYTTQISQWTYSKISEMML